jgi:uridine kinase
MLDLKSVTDNIVGLARTVQMGRSVLVGISGIDGAGKGYFSAALVDALQSSGMRVAAIKVDDWLNLPNIRFDNFNPAEHFYLRAVRFDQMFEHVILPLRDRRSVKYEASCSTETAHEFLPKPLLAMRGGIRAVSSTL